MQYAPESIPQSPLFEQNYLHELSLAAEFQRAVLPKIIDVGYLDIAVRYQPFDTVSGDVYDFKLNRERELAIFVGDATGHGISAALMTMMVHIAIDSLTPNLATDASMRKLNQLIALRHTNRSVSAALFRICPNGLLSVTHAGHPSIIVLPANNSEPFFFKQAGCALGMFDDEPVSYQEERYQLQKGDKVVAFTDGLLEWKNKDGETFGIDRLSFHLKQYRDLSTQELVDCIYQKAKAFAEHQYIRDDLTLLIAAFK